MDFYAAHQSAHNTYDRWGRGADDIKIKYLEDRHKAIERTKYQQALKNAKVKKDSPAAPGSTSGSPSGMSADQHADALRQKYGRKSTPTAGGAPADKLVWSDRSPSSPHPGNDFSRKGYNQPPLTRSTSFPGTSPLHTLRPTSRESGSPSAPARPSMMQAVREGVANIQARRIEQDTRMAQAQRARPVQPPGALGRAGQAMVNKAAEIGERRAGSTPAAPKPSGSWLQRTGSALQARADQIGTERAVRNYSFDAGAQSHRTGQGRRLF